MFIDADNKREFKTRAAAPVAAADLFLPSVVDIVKYMAQIAAEEDYRYFLATGEIPHTATHDDEEAADG